MTTYVYRNGELVEKSQAYSDPKLWKTSVISDSMEPTKHMATGRIIDSKARFRAETKAAGCIETGNERIVPRKPIPLSREQRRNDIRRAVYNLRNGIKSGTRYSHGRDRINRFRAGCCGNPSG